MAGFSEDGDGSNNSTSQKRQRTLAPTSEPSGDTEGKKKRTATLLDLDAIDCPVCFDTLTIPIFQCENGHIVCSTCCQKLRRKCATCSLPTRSRNRAMERVLELLRVPCPNAEFGCSESFSYVERSTHLERCAFAQRACPFSSCDFVGSSLGLYEHSVAKHCETEYMFECGKSVFLCPSSDKRVILKERTAEEEGEGDGEFVVVECFDTPQGRIIYASCIGPGTDKFFYELKFFFSGGDRLWFESRLKRVREVSNEPPGERFMMVPSCMCPDYKLHICISRKSS